MAPFTGDYFKYLRDKNVTQNALTKMCKCAKPEPDLTPLEEDNGWQISDKSHYVVKEKIWKVTGLVGSVTRVRGECKRTYEVIGDHGCSSYTLDKIPAYKVHRVLISLHTNKRF